MDLGDHCDKFGCTFDAIGLLWDWTVHFWCAWAALLEVRWSGGHTRTRCTTLYSTLLYHMHFLRSLGLIFDASDI